MLKLSRREWFFLISVWVVIASLMCGLVVWFLVLRPGSQADLAGAAVESAAAPTAAPTYTVAFVEASARRLYPAAEALARAWETDAQLVGADAGWSATAVNLVGNPTDWAFRFYSPSRQRMYLVGVGRDGQAAGVPHFQKEPSPPPVINLETWTVDSPEALARWLDNGGGALLGQNPGIDVTMRLGVDPASGGATWIITAFDANGQPSALKIDAATGQVSPWQP